MEKLWSLNFSIFTMIAVGFLIRKLRLMGKEAERVITDLVLYVVLPCSILNSFLGQNQEIVAGDYLTVFLVSIGVQVAAMIYGKNVFPHQPPDRRCILSYGMICSNAGLLGNAVTEGVFGAAGLLLTSLYLIPMRIMMWSEGLATFSGITDRRSVIRKVLTHPCIIACELGLIIMLLNWNPPELLVTPVQSIGRCNTPLTMMMIGMILSEIDLHHLADRTIVWFTLHRLVGMPLWVYAVCSLLHISRLVTGVCVLLAAMPAGATTTMMASKYNRDPQFATRLVIFTTLCSIPAIFLWSIILT